MDSERVTPFAKTSERVRVTGSELMAKREKATAHLARVLASLFLPGVDLLLLLFSDVSHTAMPEIVYSVAASLDGYIATSDGRVDWLARFAGAAEDHGAGDLQSSADALLMGSHTYEFALQLGHWPSPDKPSWVFTHRDLRVLHPSITLTSQSPAEVVELIAARGVRRAWLMGGGELATSFRSARLLSRLVIAVFPVILGSGIPLFAPTALREDSLRLIEAKPFASGIVQLSYQCAPHA